MGTNRNDVNDAVRGDPGVFVWKGYQDPNIMCFDPGTTTYNPMTLQLWTTYYWRIDTIRKPPNLPQVSKGPVLSFTTGCELFPGDINLDCVVNFADYAMLADDWRVEVFFPDDVQP